MQQRGYHVIYTHRQLPTAATPTTPTAPPAPAANPSRQASSDDDACSGARAAAPWSTLDLDSARTACAAAARWAGWRAVAKLAMAVALLQLAALTFVCGTVMLQHAVAATFTRGGATSIKATAAAFTENAQHSLMLAAGGGAASSASALSAAATAAAADAAMSRRVIRLCGDGCSSAAAGAAASAAGAATSAPAAGRTSTSRVLAAHEQGGAGATGTINSQGAAANNGGSASSLFEAASPKKRTGIVVLVMTYAANTAVHERLRASYGQYNGIAASGSVTLPFTYLLVVPSPNGTAWVDGDVLYTKGKEGYLEQPAKTRTVLREIEKLYDYDYVFRTDDDTHVCMNRLLAKILTVPEDRRPRVWGGHLTEEKWVVQDKDSKWYDRRALEQTRIKQYPPYMEGYGYMLGRQLVHDFLELDKVAVIATDMEDTSIALPMTILDKTVVTWVLDMDDCKCGRKAKSKHHWVHFAVELLSEEDKVGYHVCKSPDGLARCFAYLGPC